MNNRRLNVLSLIAFQIAENQALMSQSNERMIYCFQTDLVLFLALVLFWRSRDLGYSTQWVFTENAISLSSVGAIWSVCLFHLTSPSFFLSFSQLSFGKPIDGFAVCKEKPTILIQLTFQVCKRCIFGVKSTAGLKLESRTKGGTASCWCECKMSVSSLSSLTLRVYWTRLQWWTVASNIKMKVSHRCYVALRSSYSDGNSAWVTSFSYSSNCHGLYGGHQCHSRQERSHWDRNASSFDKGVMTQQLWFAANPSLRGDKWI